MSNGMYKHSILAVYMYCVILSAVEKHLYILPAHFDFTFFFILYIFFYFFFVIYSFRPQLFHVLGVIFFTMGIHGYSVKFSTLTSVILHYCYTTYRNENR